MDAPPATGEVPGAQGARRAVGSPDLNPSAADAPWWRRLWSFPLRAHVLLLVVVLVALIPVTRFDASFSSDEGAGILQAQRLADGQPWLRPNEVATIDPDGKAFFIALSEGGPTSFATYAKHPTYVWLLTGADRLGGVFAMTLLSALAAVLAALAGALIARRWDPSLDRWALWILGLGSPLLFDSQIVLAHTVGAALAGFAVLLLLMAIERPSWAYVAGAVGLLAGCSFFRSEGLLLGLAVAAALVILGLRRRRTDLALAGAAIVVASLLAAFVDRFWVGQILGTGTASLNTVDTNFVSGRLSAAATTFLLPGATWPAYAYYGLVAMLIALVTTACIVRRPPIPSLAVRVGSAVVVVGAVLPLLATPDTINSILITCPVLTVGWFLLSKHDLGDLERQVVVMTCALFVLAVLAAQYSEGGAAEWGARFLALLLPMAVPIALIAIKRSGRLLRPSDRRWAAVALAVATLSMSILSVTSLRYYRGVSADWNALVHQAEATTSAPDLGDGDRRPLVVTTWAGLGRMTWPLDPAPRGLTLPPGTVTDYGRRLRDQKVHEFVLATQDVTADLAALDGIYEPVASLPVGPLAHGPVFVMRAV